MKYFSPRCLNQYNVEDLRPTKFSNSMDKHKCVNKEKLSINSFSYFTCKLKLSYF